jgi:hypothetical protein
MKNPGEAREGEAAVTEDLLGPSQFPSGGPGMVFVHCMTIWTATGLFPCAGQAVAMPSRRNSFSR